MKKTELAKGCHIPRIIKGCWQLSAGHGSSVNTDEAIETLIRFTEHGVTTFDCADIYTGVETLLGAFRQRHTEAHEGKNSPVDIRFHTKFVPDLDRLTTVDPEYVESIIRRSIQRLGVTTIDLVQFHWWDFDIKRYVETAQVLADLQSKGLIRHLGVTNFDTTHLREIVESGVEIVSNQVQYSLLDRRPEQTMVQFCNEAGIKLLCYGTLAGGFLSSRWLNKKEPTEVENRSLVKYKLMIDDAGGWQAFQKLLSSLEAVRQKHTLSDISSVAMGYVLGKKQVGAIITGTHEFGPALHEALQLRLDTEDAAFIDEAVRRLRVILGDIYALEREKGGKHASVMRCNLNAKE